MLEDGALIQFAKELSDQLSIALQYANEIIEYETSRPIFLRIPLIEDLSNVFGCLNKNIDKLINKDLQCQAQILSSALLSAFERIETINFFKRLNCSKKWPNCKFMLVDTTSYFLGDTAENASKFETWLNDGHYFYSKAGDWIAVVVRNGEAAKNFAGRFGLKAYFFLDNNAVYPDFDKGILDFDTELPNYGLEFLKIDMWEKREKVMRPSDEVVRTAIDRIYERYQERVLAGL